MVVVRALKRRQSRCQVSVVHPREGNTFATGVENEVRNMMWTSLSRSHTQIGCDLLETLLRKLELIEIFRMSIHLRCIPPRICGKRALSDLVISLEFFVQRGRTIVRFAISLVAQRRHRLRNSSLCSLLWYERLHGLHVGPTRFPASK